MKIQNVNDAAFSKYGKVVTNVDFAPLVAAINESTPLPDDVAYEPSVEVLEATSVFEELKVKRQPMRFLSSAASRTLSKGEERLMRINSRRSLFLQEQLLRFMPQLFTMHHAE